MKKIILGLLLLGVCFGVAGCGNKNIEGNFSDIMSMVYEGISEEELPMMVENIPLNDENFKMYTFIDMDYKEAIASESMTGATPHSVVLVRFHSASDAEKAKEEMKKNADPRKWICVEAEHVYVESKGDLVILIMSNDIADRLKENFVALK